MIKTTHDIKGKLTIQKYDSDGVLVDHRTANNSITIAGRKLVAELFRFNMLGNEEDKINRITTIHVGGSQAPFQAGHTALQDTIGQTSIQSVELEPTADDRIRLRIVGELDTDNSNGELKEAGLFTQDDPPVMYNRVTFDTITKSAEFKLTLIWELTF
ncbi:MAG: hypothetical protein AAGA66_02315 [Bacteroidota bacterium]